MSLRNVNLNLLPMLQALLHYQSVSAAADALGLTQPAVSAALSRLRLLLNDPLLVKAGRRMELTSRAHALIAPVDEACDAIQRVWSEQPFDPLTAKRTFVIASADHGPLVIAPPVLRALASKAPSISLQFIDFSFDHLLKPHERRIDFLIAPRSVFDGIDHKELHILALTPPEDFVAIVGPHHALARKKTVTKADIAAQRHVHFHPGATRANDLFDLIAGYRPDRFVAARFPQFIMLPIIAALTDSVAITPRQVANQMKKVMPICILEDEEPASQTDLSLAWSPIFAADSAHAWLRDLIIGAVQEKP